MFQSLIKNLKPILLAAGLMALSATASVAQDFRVEGAGLEAVPVRYEGLCPGLIKFVGKIQASGAGRVKYTYFYSDGATGPDGFVDFEGPGVKYVSTTWQLGGPGLTHYEGWAAIRILYPNDYESNKAKFVMDCNPADGQKPGPNDGAQLDSPGLVGQDHDDPIAKEAFESASPAVELPEARVATARRRLMNVR